MKPRPGFFPTPDEIDLARAVLAFAQSELVNETVRPRARLDIGIPASIGTDVLFLRRVVDDYVDRVSAELERADTLVLRANERYRKRTNEKENGR